MNELVIAFQKRYSSALLADAAYRAGAPPGVPPEGLAPLAQRHKLAWPVVTVQANNDLVSILGAVPAGCSRSQVEWLYHCRFDWDDLYSQTHLCPLPGFFPILRQFPHF